MAVHDVIGTMSLQQVRHEALENPGLSMAGTVEDAAPQQPELALQRPAAVVQDQNVHRKTMAIDMPQQVQKPHLDPAAIDAA